MADIKIDAKPVAKDHSGVLASLWRKVIIENKLNYSLNILINNYLTKTKALETKSSTIKRKNKTTLVDNISSPKMTFKTLTDLLFNVLGCIKIDFSIKIYFKGGRTSVHTVTVTKEDNIGEEDATENPTSDK